MGREATCHADWPGGSGEVRAFLETHELIVRGLYRRMLPLAGLTATADGDALLVGPPDDRIILHLGAATAASWAAKIATPPPTLAAKLGIAAATRVHAIGVTDPALAAALALGRPAKADADLTIAEVADPAALERAVAAAGATLWLAYVKGKASPYGESAIRTAMRDCGWIDLKVASVSDRLTATKFVRR